MKAVPLKLDRIDDDIITKYKLNERQSDFIAHYLTNGHLISEAYHSVYNPTVEFDTVHKPTLYSKASRLMATDKVKFAIADQIKRLNSRRGINVITIEEVLDILGGILQKEDAADKDKIRAGEILLKHLNAFKEHNNSKASKTMNIIAGRTTEELREHVQQLQLTLSEEEILPNNLSPSELLDDFDEDDFDNYELTS